MSLSTYLFSGDLWSWACNCVFRPRDWNMYNVLVNNGGFYFRLLCSYDCWL